MHYFNGFFIFTAACFGNQNKTKSFVDALERHSTYEREFTLPYALEDLGMVDVNIDAVNEIGMRQRLEADVSGFEATTKPILSEYPVCWKIKVGKKDDGKSKNVFSAKVFLDPLFKS